MSNILITGGAGFIGSHLVDRLLSEGHKVVVIDNLSLGLERNIAHNLSNVNFEFIKGDVLDKNLMTKVFDGTKFDIVFHLAANSDIARSHADPSASCA